MFIIFYFSYKLLFFLFVNSVLNFTEQRQIFTVKNIPFWSICNEIDESVLFILTLTTHLQNYFLFLNVGVLKKTVGNRKLSLCMSLLCYYLGGQIHTHTHKQPFDFKMVSRGKYSRFCSLGDGRKEM